MSQKRVLKSESLAYLYSSTHHVIYPQQGVKSQMGYRHVFFVISPQWFLHVNSSRYWTNHKRGIFFILRKNFFFFYIVLPPQFHGSIQYKRIRLSIFISKKEIRVLKYFPNAYIYIEAMLHKVVLQTRTCGELCWFAGFQYMETHSINGMLKTIHQ